LPSSSPRLVLIFDLDGTLAETREDIAASANHALSTVGLPPLPVATITGFVGEGAPRLIERCLGPRQDLFDPALAAWRAHYAEHLLDATRLYPGVADTLKALPAPLAVLTNKPEGMSRRILDGLGVAGRFEAVVGGDTLPVKKPSPDGVRHIMEATRSGGAVLVGDSAIDLATAKSARVPFWGASYGFGGRGELAGADAVVERFEDVLGLRRRLG
jgi:phosphoglycolate phosphatase